MLTLTVVFIDYSLNFIISDIVNMSMVKNHNLFQTFYMLIINMLNDHNNEISFCQV